jgi:subtilisin-like proprotein convertase family protein
MKRYMKLAGIAALMTVPNQAKAQVTYNYTGPNLGVTIPDGVAAGLNYDITVPNSGPLSAISIGLTMNPAHTWSGDLIMTINHIATTSNVFGRLGGGANQNDLAGPYTFIDTATIGLNAAVGSPIPSGNYRATDGADAFITLNTVFGGQNINGLWRINISDNSAQDTGAVSALSITLTAVPEPTSLALVGVGAAGLGWRRWRRKV